MTNPRHPAKLAEARKALWQAGKCGSISKNGNLCNLTANHRPSDHEWQYLGGIRDGETLEKWSW